MPSGRPKITEEEKMKKPSYRAKIKHLLKVRDYGAKVNYNDPQQIATAFEWYFEQCALDDLVITVEGLAMSIGVTRQTLAEWQREGGKGQDVASTIKMAKNFIASAKIMALNDGSINPIAAIFDLTNNHDYEREASSKTNITFNVTMTPEQLQHKYSSIATTDYEVLPEVKALPDDNT